MCTRESASVGWGQPCARLPGWAEPSWKQHSVWYNRTRVEGMERHHGATKAACPQCAVGHLSQKFPQVCWESSQRGFTTEKCVLP